MWQERTMRLKENLRQRYLQQEDAVYSSYLMQSLSCLRHTKHRYIFIGEIARFQLSCRVALLRAVYQKQNFRHFVVV